MSDKTLLQVMEEVLDQFWQTLIEKTTSFAKDVKRRIKARKIVGLCADPSSYHAVVNEIVRREKEHDALMMRQENYYRNILLGTLDMIEAIMLRYDILSPEQLTDGMLDRINELFYGGKRRALMYARWLCIADDSVFVKDWIPILEPLKLDSYTTVEGWIDFFDNLPV